MRQNRHDRRRLDALRPRREPQPPLLNQLSQADRALRDVMMVIERLAVASSQFGDGLNQSASLSLSEAFQSFLAIPDGSPLIHAYLRWLEENDRVGKGTSAMVGEPEDDDDSIGPDGRLSPGGDE